MEFVVLPLTKDPADIQICRRHRDLAMAHAVRYAEFVRIVSLT
jgi:hypothetical protein